MNANRIDLAGALELKPVYGPDDLTGLGHLGDMPGEAPFVRGPYSTMYRGRPWTIRQYAGYGDAATSNLAYREALKQGAQGLSVAFDLPTHRGYDSDDPQAQADVGMAGVAIDSVDDMRRLFKGIALDRVSASMTMSGAVLPVLAAFFVAAEESGVPFEQLRGTIQNDILKEFMVRNTWIHAPQPSLRIATDVVEWLAAHAPKFNGMSISGYHFQEAGADPVLELALTLANARTYVGLLRERGLDVDAFCGGLSFFFGVGKPFFVEIAKLRAARLLWHDIVCELGGTSARATAMRMHCQTSGWTLAAQQPLNNIARTTVEAMAAIFGGTQSLHTNGFDEALALPGAQASRLARDTQLILQHEFGLCEVADPWAGSYLIESLTGRMVTEVRAVLAHIDAQGGILPALESGWVQRRIHQAALRTQARLDAVEEVVVGVNRYQEPDDNGQECLEIDGTQVRVKQACRLDALRSRRDDGAVRHALAALTEAARRGKRNLLACAIDAMRCRATVGECTRALLQVWPRHTVQSSYDAALYGTARAGNTEWLAACDCVSALHERLGRAPRILVAKLGQDGHDRGARAVAAGLADAGFVVELTPLFQSAEAVASSACDGDFDAIGISTLGGAHLELLPALLHALRQRALDVPVFVGGIVPADHRRLLRQCGVQGIFGPGTPMEIIVSTIVAALTLSRMPTASAPFH
ncbi:Methylmalonyl-CoA mutase large subunit, MutB [Cupriavidus necator H850]|uniref:methylmalonyl-CoA mutase n=1 Tax=Cupriavidus necator TaxID=106590 RepID=UPI00129DC9D1|nr:methylmalonyl-CoA mutase [Cupriavidus necator]KAI3607307.1 Methylmalonyl-CoA mutase large subunit, MutB [Cupriavidus necator H850]